MPAHGHRGRHCRHHLHRLDLKVTGREVGTLLRRAQTREACDTAFEPSKNEAVESLIMALDSVVRARGTRYLMANVPRRSLEAVKRIIPGINGPTVIDILNGGDRVAVHAVVDAATVYKTIGALKASMQRHPRYRVDGCAVTIAAEKSYSELSHGYLSPQDRSSLLQQRSNCSDVRSAPRYPGALAAGDRAVQMARETTTSARAARMPRKSDNAACIHRPQRAIGDGRAGPPPSTPLPTAGHRDRDGPESSSAGDQILSSASASMRRAVVRPTRAAC